MEKPNHDHAWRGAWNRPIKVDEDAFDALTVARMTDHNVRGCDEVEQDQETTDPELPITSDQDGHYDIDGVSLARKKGYRVIVASDASH